MDLEVKVLVVEDLEIIDLIEVDLMVVEWEVLVEDLEEEWVAEWVAEWVDFTELIINEKYI